ncbi:MAG: SMP-30/gluconolactonase/LRE family protein [Rhizomicrobium sp.]
MRIARVETRRCRGGEGPLWDPADQALYFIDNTGQKVHRFDPAAGATRSWDMPCVITALALRQDGGAVVTLRSGIHTFDFETGALELLSPLDAPPPFVFNDGKVDRRGRFLIGASTANFANPTPDGGLYRLDPDHRLSVLDTGVHFSNGPCWSPDDTTFYFSDSFLYTAYAYDYDIETGEVTNKRPFVNTRELGGLPDGATVDRDGLVWIAIYGAGKVAAFRPDGRLERVVEMPVRLVSSVMFGGSNLDQLYVATIEHGALGEPSEEGAGDVYVIEGLGARGVPEPRYAG